MAQFCPTIVVPSAGSVVPAPAGETVIEAIFITKTAGTPDLVFQSVHKDALKTYSEEGESYSEQVENDSYSVKAVFNLGSDFDLSAVTITTPMVFDFELYAFNGTLADCQKGEELAKFNKLVLKGVKGGVAKYAYADYDPYSMSEEPPIKCYGSIQFAWNAKKILTVTLKVNRYYDGNMMDFYDEPVGNLAGKLTNFKMIFGSTGWTLDDAETITYSGVKTIRTATAGSGENQEEFELMSWKVAGP